MANTIKHKRGSGSNPAASSLSVGELAIRTDTGVVFTKKDDGTVAEIAGGGETNLGVSTTSTAVTVTSDTGNNATISEASSSAAGVMSAAHHDKLDGIASGATANSTESIQDIVGGMVSGNSESGISVTYQDSDGTLDFSVSSQTDNNFTTTLKNKLDGIESGATADQTKSDIDALGIDADTVDGVEASSFLRSDASDVKTSGSLRFNDSVKLELGNGSDLQIYHNGTDSFIVDNSRDLLVRADGSGDLYLQSDNQVILSDIGGNETFIECNDDGDVKLFHNNNQKLATKSDGVDITGELQCDSLDVDGNADITGNVTLHANLDLQDSDKILLGAGDDLQIFHDGSNSYIHDNGSGDLIVRSSRFRVNNAGNTENMIRADQDGAVYLYHNNSQKFITKSDGIDVTGEVQCDSLDVDGNGDVAGQLTVNRLVVDDDGSSGPTVQIRTDDQSPWALQISNDTWSNGGNRGLLFFQGNDGTFYQRLQGVSNNWEALYIQQSNGSTTNTAIEITLNRAVALRYQNNQKLVTKSDGVDITGELQCDSLDVDGSANVTGTIDINGDIRHNGDVNCLFGFPSNDTFRIQTGGTERFRITSTGAIAIEGSSNYGSSGQVLTSNGNDAPTWQDGGGTVASGCVYENSQTISSNYSVTSGKNAMSAGPITIASGVTVTVTSGSTYTIV